jgi:tRNA (cmo5U34)-methyltransferase
MIRSDFADTGAYDRRIRRFVPYYEEMMDSVLDCWAGQESDFDALELGCGTGNLSQRLLDKNPGCRLTAVDLVEEMAEACRIRLAAYSGRVEIICADMRKFKRPDAFHQVVSSLALHYPETDAKKQAVCRNVHQSLKRGGVFSFSVMLTDDSPESSRKIWKEWEQDVLHGGVSPEELDDWYKTHHRSDHPVSPRLWLEWLKAQGFDPCDMVWRKTVFGVIRATKA